MTLRKGCDPNPPNLSSKVAHMLAKVSRGMHKGFKTGNSKG